MRTLAFLMMLFSIGCDVPDRVAKIEKDNAELHAELEKIKATSDYDMQEKCSRDSKEWLRENWATGKDTVFFSHNSHYNKGNNSCFIVAEEHDNSIFGEKGSWSNTIQLWNVLENVKYASLQEDHLVHNLQFGDDLVLCKVAGKDCKTLDEFNRLTSPYMSQ